MSNVPPTGPGYFSDTPFTAVEPPAEPPRRGMVLHVSTFAILNGIEAGLELLVSVFCLFIGVMMFVLPGAIRQQVQQQNGQDPDAVGGLYLCIGSVLLVVGLVRLVAAIRNYSFSNRVLGIVSLCLGLVAAFSGCCSLTALGVAVYGLMVLFDTEVGEAFRMKQNGVTPDQIRQTYAARRP